MSRLVIKNLPKKITEDKIRELFGQKGIITDVQLKYTPEGKFRNFGFIGYQNEKEAEDAIEYFNNMFLNTSKITVEKCALLGDTNKPKAWSKYATESTAYKNAHREENKEEEKDKKVKTKKVKKDEAAELLAKYKDDPMFEEFLQVQAPNEIEKLHNLQIASTQENDSAVDSGKDSPDEKSEDDKEDETQDKLANQEISDMEYMKKLMGKGDNSEKKPRVKMEKKVKEKIELFTVKLKDLPYNCKKKDIKHFFKPNTPYTIRIPRNIHGIAYVGFKNEKSMKKALMKDKSFIGGKQISVFSYKGDISAKEEKKDDTEDLKKNKWKSQEETLKNEEDIAESGRIFVRNLSYTTTEDDIEKMFSKYGPLTEVNLPIDNTTRKMKGFGVITFLMPEHAVKAYSELDGSILHGRMLHLLPGKSKDNDKEAQLDESTNFKQKQAAKQKSQAGSSHNWNSLFLGHDAVAEVVADSYRTTKEAVVGPDGKGSAAVRLALGETQIVAQTRKYLEEEGVVLDAFATPTTKRSKTVILIKNLPSRTEISEIRCLFEKHGEIGRIILPPSGITAIVEYFEPSEARKAFTRLAYSKFKNVPLYLEWAPENTLTGTNISRPVTAKETQSTETEKVENVEPEEEEEPEPDTTLFVKNLNFKTTDEELKKHFAVCGKVHYANVALKKDINNPDNKLSMGYGFVRFTHKSSTDKALKTLQGLELNGKTLELKRSERTLKNEAQSSRKVNKATKQTGTKILVRNVPFQAKLKEIQELFSTFGEIKALRLPKKMAAGSDSHRGFAFVDYVTNSDAKSAFEALSQSTHLYGRRLVLEWASTEEGVDVIRKRTADHFKPTEEVKSKKSVFNLE
ncbi:unnamed protein product [Brassicogethes aeneus]|uniref:RRM domain-containing protein n=1 Tax=Brassicogethes aeneus TaxID=1431903 RepID=A0A9P0F9C6_BRAAE|nr:unnamed protein product [Brassicogethes aeneus]